MTITLLKMSIREIIDLNGAFIGCLFVYILPATMHIRCLYFNKNRVAIGEKEKSKEEHKYDVMVEENNLELERKEKSKETDVDGHQ